MASAIGCASRRSQTKTVRRFATLALARITDLIASVPERHTGNLRTDPAHRWLRACVRDSCAAIG
jgi:hypothetical protein